MTRRGGGGGWTSPQVIVSCLMLLFSVLVFWNGLKKDESDEIDELDRKVARLEVIVEHLKADRATPPAR